jgi:hypothetical protein
MFHEWHEPIEVYVEGLGHGRCVLIERTQHDYFWTVFMDSCAVVTVEQRKIRVTRNYSHGRGFCDREMRNITRAHSRRAIIPGSSIRI